MQFLEVKVSVAQLYPTLCNPMDCSPPGSSVHGDFLGKNTGVGSHSLFQGITGLIPGAYLFPHLLKCMMKIARPPSWGRYPP